jgi:tryptophan-rich sensory protein
MTAIDRALIVAESPSRWSARLADLAIVATPVVGGGICGFFTFDAIRGWYRTLVKPAWNPPDWVFGPVWTTLYLMMGIALVQVVRADRDVAARQVAAGLFGVQLALNFGWSWVFFANHDLGAALVEIVALWLAIAVTIAAFATIRRSAAALLVPYLAWTTFATVLTASIWRLNR